MTRYRGDRTIDGPVVLRDDSPLQAGTDVVRYSDHGVDWGCVAGPARQLAFALLLDHLGDRDRAQRMVPLFTDQIVARLANDWEFDTDYLAAAVDWLEATPD